MVKYRIRVRAQGRYRRHGVKEQNERKSSEASVGKLLRRGLTGTSAPDKGESTSSKAAKPWGSNLTATSSYDYFGDKEISLDDSNPEAYAAAEQELNSIIMKATNIATRLESHTSYDISELKARYKAAKDSAFAEILGEQSARVLSQTEEDALNDKLSHLTFTYYEVYILIIVETNEIVPEWSHCKQKTTTSDGMYIYHFRSKTILFKELPPESFVKGLLKDEDTSLVKALSTKTSIKYKTILRSIIDGNGNIISFKRIREALTS